MAAKNQREQELMQAYEKRLMRSAMKRRSPSSAGDGSSSANAAAALKSIAGVPQRPRVQQPAAAKMREPDVPAPKPAVPTPKSAVAAPQPLVPVRPADRPGNWRLVAGGLATVGLLGLGGLFFMLASTGGRHSVSGTVLLDNRPLDGIELFFHPRDRSCVPIRVTTTDGGAFCAESLPAGDYSVALAAVDGSVDVPQRYLSKDSTPFRIDLRRDRTNLRIIASSRKAR